MRTPYELKVNLFSLFRLNRLIAKLIANLRPLKRDFILDIGCGTGLATRRIAEEFESSRVFGVDMDRARVRTARRLGCQPNSQYVVGDGLSLGFQDNYFDIVIASLVFHHIKNKGKLIREIKRVLRGGGTVLYFDLRVPMKEIARRITTKIGFGHDRTALSEHLNGNTLTLLDRAFTRIRYRQRTLSEFVIFRCAK